jgi:hypothetical protein
MVAEDEDWERPVVCQCRIVAVAADKAFTLIDDRECSTIEVSTLRNSETPVSDYLEDIIELKRARRPGHRSTALIRKVLG